jgi:hypothetical protein
MKKILILGLILSFITIQGVEAKDPLLDPVDEFLDKFVAAFNSDFFDIIEETFKEKVIPVWKTMYEWFEENIWNKIKPQTRAEIERRKEIAKAEAEKEKEELKKELEDLFFENSFLESIKEFLIGLLE